MVLFPVDVVICVTWDVCSATEQQFYQQSEDEGYHRPVCWRDRTPLFATSSQCHCRHTTQVMTVPTSSDRMHSDLGLFWIGLRCTNIYVADWSLERKQTTVGSLSDHGWQLMLCSSLGASSGWCLLVACWTTAVFVTFSLICGEWKMSSWSGQWWFWVPFGIRLSSAALHPVVQLNIDEVCVGWMKPNRGTIFRHRIALRQWEWQQRVDICCPAGACKLWQ